MKSLSCIEMWEMVNIQSLILIPREECGAKPLMWLELELERHHVGLIFWHYSEQCK